MLGISPYKNIKYIAPILALTAFTTLNSCKNNEPQKALYNVELNVSNPYCNTPNTKIVKLEDQVSFENNSKKYIMTGGKLYSYDKRKHEWQEDKHIEMKQYQFDVFEKVAELHNELGDTLVLSAKDIKAAKEKMKDKYISRTTAGTRDYSYQSDFFSNDNSNTHSVYVTNSTGSNANLIFKFNDIINNNHK